MSFRVKRVQAVLWKDVLDMRKNRGLLWSMGVLPAVLVAVPILVVYAYARDPNDPSLRVMAAFYDPAGAQAAGAAKFLIAKTLTDWFGLYLIMPVMIPILISSHAVAGEKERRTLEPLLASPVTPAELVAGKSLAAVLPSVGVSLAAFGALCAGVDWVAWPVYGELLLPNGMWLFGVLVVAPLFAFFGNGVSVLVSARVGDTRLAQQISGLVTLPLLGLAGAQAAGVLRAGASYYALVGAFVFLCDVGLMWASVRLFDRERLISRWT